MVSHDCLYPEVSSLSLFMVVPSTISEFSGGVTQRLFAVPFFHEKSIRSDGSGTHAHTLMQYPLLSH